MTAAEKLERFTETVVERVMERVYREVYASLYADLSADLKARRKREPVRWVDTPKLVALLDANEDRLEKPNGRQEKNLRDWRGGGKAKLKTAVGHYKARGGDPREVEALEIGHSESEAA